MSQDLAAAALLLIYALLQIWLVMTRRQACDDPLHVVCMTLHT